MNTAILGRGLLVVLLLGVVGEARSRPSVPRGMGTGTAALQGDRPSARWLGQIGSDRVGRSPRDGPNGVQDIVFELVGLPADRAIERVEVQGHGGDAWGFHSPKGHWAAVLERVRGSDRARLSVEPSRVETGRTFTIEVAFEGGAVVSISVAGGTADPMVRMPDVQLAARWAGTDGSDHVGVGTAVGPDGFEDVRIDLARLDPAADVTELLVRAEGGPSWSYGANPDGNRDALFIRSSEDRSRGAVYLGPSAGLAGARVRIDLAYDNHTSDRVVLVAGDAPTDRPIGHPELPEVRPEDAPVRWLGQDDRAPLGPGAVRLAVDRPSGGQIRAAVLSDGVAGAWVFEQPAGDDERSESPFFGAYRRPLDLAEGERPGSLVVSFVPYRDEKGTEMTLRLLDEDGHSSVYRFEGQQCDPLRRFASPSSRAARVRPGDDLAAMAEQGGTIRLSPGTYHLDRPLDLPEPTTLLADPGAELRFRQPTGSEPWGEAVAIRGAGRTTIEGLRVRFDGPVRWHPNAAWGGAIVGVSNLGKRPGGPLHVEVRGLDLEAPPASTEWEPAPNCLRLVDTDSGVVEGCTLRGGAIELFDGPWTIAGNRHLGTMPGTFAHSFLSGHLTRDIEVIDNEIRPEDGSGKLYRFLVLTDRGVNVTVRGNTVVGVGPMDDDARPHPNAPEVLLTESYQLRFEGRHAGLSADGRVLAIPDPQGEHPEVGEVVAVLDGPDAGRWAVIDQVLDRNTFLLDPPLPTGDFNVSITPGFVGMMIEGNTIDCRGSTQANGIVLTGNHYGTGVVGNTVRGGSHAFRLSSYASNRPVHYGWSHTPCFDLRVESNEVIDSARGGLIAVHHGPGQKASRGRVYLTGTVSGNTFRWTTGATAVPEDGPVALTIGELPALDPAELSLTTGRNTARDVRGQSPPEPMRIRVGTVNGRSYHPPSGE